jgi:hypothetical protein
MTLDGFSSPGQWHPDAHLRCLVLTVRRSRLGGPRFIDFLADAGRPGGRCCPLGRGRAPAFSPCDRLRPSPVAPGWYRSGLSAGMACSRNANSRPPRTFQHHINFPTLCFVKNGCAGPSQFSMPPGRTHAASVGCDANSDGKTSPCLWQCAGPRKPWPQWEAA